MRHIASKAPQRLSRHILLQDVVNVFKHGAASRWTGRHTDIYETKVLTEYEDAEGPYQDAEKEVTIQLRDRRFRTCALNRASRSLSHRLG